MIRGLDSHLLGLFDLQLREEVDEPLEGPLVAIDPEEVNLLGDKQIDQCYEKLKNNLIISVRKDIELSQKQIVNNHKRIANVYDC